MFEIPDTGHLVIMDNHLRGGDTMPKGMGYGGSKGTKKGGKKK